MTFFYDLNKKLQQVAEAPKSVHQQLNERANSKPVEEGLGDMVQKVGGAAKKVGSAVLNKLGHGSDADMMRDLQKKMGVPQTGQKPQQPKEGVDKVAFAKLAPPRDKITFADKIAGAKKEVDEMLGDVAAEAIKGALSPKQKKLDVNKNGKIDGDDLSALRKGKKVVADEGSTGDYSAKKARAGKDIGKPGKGFAKIAAKAGKKYGSKAAGERVAGAVLNKLRHPSELEENAAAGYDPQTQARIKAATPQQLAQMAQEFAGGPAQYQSELKMLQQAKAELSGQMEEGWDDMLKDVEKRRGAMKTGEKRKTSKGEVEKTATGIRHTRSYDAKTGETDTGDDAQASGEKRGRGRPKGPARAPERVTGGATKHKGGRKTNEGAGPDDIAVLERLMDEAFANGNNALGNAIQGVLEKMGSGEKQVDEKAVSKAQQRFMGMVHATQKGEKAPSKEVAKVAKTMKKKDAEDFASTKHKGLPEKKKPAAKKKEKTEEQGGSGTPTASSGFSFGKGIYDSINHELETMIAESMSINISSSTEGGNNITVTASEEDAQKLAAILKNAGLGGEQLGDEQSMGGEPESCPTCGSADCGCGDVHEALDENQPDWPTDEETSDDALQYSGGLNGPKSTGQTVGAPFNRQNARQGAGELVGNGVNEDAELVRMRDLAGIKEAKKVEEDDVEEGNKFTGNLAKARAAGKSEADLDGDGDMEKVQESVNNLWTEYKGKYGV